MYQRKFSRELCENYQQISSSEFVSAVDISNMREHYGPSSISLLSPSAQFQFKIKPSSRSQLVLISSY
ncbi:hypothetical protein FGO68_gene12178 [Halteria grandinella]|uniref:Uncharacterized protein n=1 Tax=Halteria grandinella TaxID=5974 RepID=A0A8J8NRL9_HALGN|nr:hypothetical protein FGO68_gene12178 [Halteria grandinella]